jgi:hypothetical protein
MKWVPTVRIVSSPYSDIKAGSLACIISEKHKDTKHHVYRLQVKSGGSRLFYPNEIEPHGPSWRVVKTEMKSYHARWIDWAGNVYHESG